MTAFQLCHYICLKKEFFIFQIFNFFQIDISMLSPHRTNEFCPFNVSFDFGFMYYHYRSLCLCICLCVVFAKRPMPFFNSSLCSILNPFSAETPHHCHWQYPSSAQTYSIKVDFLHIFSFHIVSLTFSQLISNVNNCNIFNFAANGSSLAFNTSARLYVHQNHFLLLTFYYYMVWWNIMCIDISILRK